ncbi:hypothetical protein CBP34_01920 [Acidovorax carolinensis]|uniref:Uncharacterized protein n=2 Tax=Acidovorax carolinensis TaxID=553814 RepID=A0A240TZT3_9BURK|nr:hypothetical protein CBP34_01920 [Acidovorax carolinensis]
MCHAPRCSWCRAAPVYCRYHDHEWGFPVACPMTHVCPHCQKRGVSNAALRWSTREGPAQCGYCAGLSHVLASTSSAIGVFTWMTLIGGLVLGLVLSSVAVAVAGLLVAGLGNVWMWRRCELFPTERKAARTAQRVGWAAALFAVVMALFG